MSRIPMPSPSNTNRAGLFLPASSRAAVAYDAAPDDDEATLKLKQSEVEALLSFLEQRLQDDDMGEVRKMLAVDDNDEPDMGANDRRRSFRGASDRKPGAAPTPVRYAADVFPHARRLKV